MFEQRFRERLQMQREAGLYRKPPEVEERDGKYLSVHGRKVLNFASNDYLGLGASKKLRERVSDNFRKYGTTSSSSRLVCGHYSMISRAEKAYARHFGYEDALFFPSGYQANLGVVSSFFGRGDTVVFDKHVHASTVKGMALSKAEFLGYRHNSMSHLKKRLEARKEEQVGVLTESLFSMDGDLLDLDGIRKLKESYGFLTIVDEAHAFGALGDEGRGIGRAVADIAVGTFGKALGLFGAFVLLPEEYKEYLFNFSSPLIYSTTLPEAHAASAVDALEIMSESESERRILDENSRLMKETLRSEGFLVSGDAHIIAVELGDEARAARVARSLFENGIFAFPARYPTVPLGKAILRISMTALHSGEDVALFVETLKGVNESVQRQCE
ncbi:MAG TPA: pyridoxal phosphate-dependent aminotransferase family protein [Syntrophobacteria bacterium]|nr:pyridoxal phosphate-dependent aminotransferase family protein [Syntrophobacteria bacterium]